MKEYIYEKGSINEGLEEEETTGINGTDILFYSVFFLIEVGFFYDIDLGLPVLLTYVGVKLSVKWCDWTVILEYCFHLRENKIGQILPFLKARDYNYCPSIPPIISSFHFRRVILIRQRFCNLKKTPPMSILSC